MTVEEIFSQVSQHMIEGLMMHSQLSDYYLFLGTKGYAKCHKYHYFEENSNYKKFNWYYLEHFNKLVIEKSFNNPKVIPQDWYMYNRQSVDEDVRKVAIEKGFEKWINWEKDTKKLYEQHYQNLMSNGEVAAAIELKNYIKNVDNELAEAENELLFLKAINFNISDIMMEQDDLYKKYKKELKEIKL